MEVKTITLPLHGDATGNLVAVESVKDVPFEIKRIYYITATDGKVRRGFHAHKELKQVLFCPRGSCTILLDDGYEKTDVVLDKPNVGLVIDRVLWREMYNFSDDAVLLALVSDYYTEDDYIRNYDDFLRYVREGK
ncbi:MAG: WxcM-like domain-containing protein [Lachnospiraceae bacterium]|nr:WxcM-like domain-containing protein [Lachnospiraceae bacterium]